MTREDLLSKYTYDKLTGYFKNIKTSKKVGFLNNKGYIQIQIEGKKYLAHRLAWLCVFGEFPKGQIDHINMDKLDNRIENLRDVTNSINGHNRITKSTNNSSTGHIGVSFYKKTGKYKSQISIDGKDIHLGYFKTIGEASDKYNEFKSGYFK